MFNKLINLLATLAGIWMALAVAGFTAKLVWLSILMGWELL